ncbi:MAG: ribonuclease Y [Patescibacteria group bacterium]|nr:ribonuclease Y [Patescibacteria group bacterium]
MNILNFINQAGITHLITGLFCLITGSVLGYLARQSIAKKQIGTIEQKIQKKIANAKQETKKMLFVAKEKAFNVLETAKKEENRRRNILFKTEQAFFKKENILENKIAIFEKKETEFSQKVDKLKEIKESIETLKQESLKKLEKISSMSQKQAKDELLKLMEKESELEILEKMRKLEENGQLKYEKKAREILTLAIQRCAISQSQEITTSSVALPNEKIKGRIIGKEGRNIKSFEETTGVEVIVGDDPETVIISAFDPVRRHIAKKAMEKLILDGRIQPARIEEIVEDTRKQINTEMEKAGEQAMYETGILGLEPKLIQLLGRLRFRTSYGQNVLLHSIEVSLLAGSIAGELGADVKIAEKAGFLHDIGKALDYKVQGSHIDIGIKILEKLNIEQEVIDAMKSHHGDYPYESLEAIIVQTADAISGARPGARKDTLENYLKRLEDLENVALSFPGVKKAWALRAGKEIRVFVKPEEINDLTARRLAKDIAKKVEEELRYPGEIKVNIIRETRIVEYAK